VSRAAAAAPGADLVYLRSAGFVLLAGLFWSTGGVLVKLVEAADSIQIVLWRSLFVLPVVAAFIAARGSGVAGLRGIGWNDFVGGCLLAAAFVTFVTALTLTTVANAVFVLAATPFMAALLGRLILGEAIHRSTWLAMAAAGLGVAIIAAPGLGSGRLAGTLLALASCLSFALFSVTLRRGRALDGTPSLLLAALISAAVCGMILVLGRGPGALAIGRHDLLACAAMGIVQIGCGLIAFTLGARHLPAADLTLLAQTEVVLAPVWAWLVVGEVPAFWTLVGGGIVLAAVLAQAVAGTRRGIGQTARNG
jgi:DME family drug/metabolite transporter